MPKKPAEIGTRYIEIIVGADGQTKVEAHGFTDKTCREATNNLEVSIGSVKSRSEKNTKDPRQTIRKG